MPDDIKSDSPRKTLTLVLSERPTFRWDEVPGASYYLVSLMAGSETYWEERVSRTEIVCPGDKPLKQGVFYSLVIKSDNDFSSESALDKPELKFNPLASGSVQKIESRIDSPLKSQTVSFVFCPRGGACITASGLPGTWAFSFQKGCFCLENIIGG